MVAFLGDGEGDKVGRGWKMCVSTFFKVILRLK